MRSMISIGIAGGSGSGKTTLSRFLASGLSEYKVKMIHMDKYYKEKRPIATAPFSGKQYEDFNHPSAIHMDKVLEDFQYAALKEDVVIIEGFLLFHDARLRENMDYKIFVDCPSDERLARRLDNFVNGRYSREEVINEYLELVRHRHDEYVEPTRWYADLIMNGSKGNQKGSQIVLEWLLQKLG